MVRYPAIGNNLIITNTIHQLSCLLIYSQRKASCYSPAPGRSRKHHIVPQNKREIRMKYPQASLRMFLSSTVVSLLKVPVAMAEKLEPANRNAGRERKLDSHWSRVGVLESTGEWREGESWSKRGERREGVRWRLATVG